MEGWGGRVVLQDLDGGGQDVGVVRQAVGFEEVLVATQDGGDEGLSARGRARAVGALGQRGGPDAPKAERRHRMAHRVPEAHLLGETREAEAAAGAERLVQGALHQRVFVEGVDDRAAREGARARNEIPLRGVVRC